MPPTAAPPPEPAPRQHPNPGPNPLALHLGLSNLIWLSWPLLWQRLKPKSPTSKPGLPQPNWSPSLRQRAAKLGAASAKLPPERWLGALATEGLRRQQAYLAGVKLYRRQSLAVQASTPLMLQQIGSTKLLDYAPQLHQAPTLLVIPSLINRARILDLSPERGFLRWLVQQKIRPLLIDWNAPYAEEAGLTVSEYCARLQQFLPMLQQNSGSSPRHLFGHCLGGNLALALAALSPQQFRSLTLCSTPWDFQAGDPFLGQQAQLLWQKIAAQKKPDRTHPAEFAAEPLRFAAADGGDGEIPTAWAPVASSRGAAAFYPRRRLAE
jgi:polyhydroxyalkanoate synthase subunit PhaC